VFAGPLARVHPALMSVVMCLQAHWRGYILRKKLLAALEFANVSFGDSEDEDQMNLGADFDLDKFVNMDEVGSSFILIFMPQSFWGKNIDLGLCVVKSLCHT